jgi:type I restriction enzyme, S subunit
MDEWRELTLNAAAIINPTESLSKGIKAKKIAMTIIQPFTKRVTRYSVEDYNGGMKFRNGDTLVARITPCLENGKTIFVDILDDGEIGFGSTEFIVLREKEGTSDKGFLYYFALSPEFRDVAILSMTGSSGRQRVQTDVVRNHLFLLPPLPEQKAIASVLSSLDDKIDLLHRQNKTLEAMAETLFRQWFVEEAKEDWGDVCLGDIADINPTYHLKKGAVSTYLEMKNVSTSSFYPVGWYKRKFTSGMKFENGDTILARITPCLENGKTCFVTFLDEEEIGWGSTEYIIIRMKKPLHPYISYIIAKDKDFRDFAISSMSGSSGRQRAQANVIKEYELASPPLEIIEKLNCQLVGILAKCKINAIQIRTLEKLRDTLLPKLMSGEVRVKYEN